MTRAARWVVLALAAIAGAPAPVQAADAKAGLAAHLDDARDRNVVDRLTLVAEHISDQCHPIGWWLSVLDPERGVVRTTRHAVHRNASQPGEVLESGIGNEYLVQDYPQTAHALLGNVVLLGATDPETDPAELEILERMGASMLLMAGITSPGDAGWLLEIYGDAMTAPLSDFAIPVRALMALAALEASPS